jgi:hypothetical protein
MKEAIDQLREKRESLVEQHKRDLAAIDHAIRLLGGVGESVPPLLPTSAPQKKLRGLRENSLATKIMSVFLAYPDVEYSSGEIYGDLRELELENLRAIGMSSAPHDELRARNAISATLGQLRDAGRIIQTQQSNGAIGARYRLAEIGEEV